MLQVHNANHNTNESNLDLSGLSHGRQVKKIGDTSLMLTNSAL
jgi:hypothetical protein